MKIFNQSQGGLLIIKFPLESAWGGEEEIHLLMAKKLSALNLRIGLLTSCPHLFAGFLFQFGCQNIYKFWFRGTDPVSLKAIILFPITGLALYLSSFFWLIFFRFKGFDQVLFLRLQEKILWSPLAYLLGYKIYWGEHCGFSRWLYANPLLLLYKLFARLAIFITPSQAMANQIIGLLGEKQRIQIIYNTIENNIEEPKTFSKREYCEFLNKKIEQRNQQLIDNNINSTEEVIHQTDFIIGYAGRLSREKGLIFLCEVAKKAIKHYPNVKFVLAGSGDFEDVLRNKISDANLQDHIFLTGFLADHELEYFFQGLDLFGLFSDYETFGMVLLRAMRASVPIVATRVGAIPEIITDGESGYLIDQGDLDDATCKIEHLINSPELRNQFGFKGQNIFQIKFSDQTFAGRVQEVFLNNEAKS